MTKVVLLAFAFSTAAPSPGSIPAPFSRFSRSFGNDIEDVATEEDQADLAKLISSIGADHGNSSFAAKGARGFHGRNNLIDSLRESDGKDPFAGLLNRVRNMKSGQRADDDIDFGNDKEDIQTDIAEIMRGQGSFQEAVEQKPSFGRAGLFDFARESDGRGEGVKSREGVSEEPLEGTGDTGGMLSGSRELGDDEDFIDPLGDLMTSQGIIQSNEREAEEESPRQTEPEKVSIPVHKGQPDHKQSDSGPRATFDDENVAENQLKTGDADDVKGEEATAMPHENEDVHDVLQNSKPQIKFPIKENFKRDHVQAKTVKEKRRVIAKPAAANEEKATEANGGAEGAVREEEVEDILANKPGSHAIPPVKSEFEKGHIEAHEAAKSLKEDTVKDAVSTADNGDHSDEDLAPRIEDEINEDAAVETNEQAEETATAQSHEEKDADDVLALKPGNPALPPVKPEYEARRIEMQKAMELAKQEQQEENIIVKDEDKGEGAAVFEEERDEMSSLGMPESSLDSVEADEKGAEVTHSSLSSFANNAKDEDFMLEKDEEDEELEVDSKRSSSETQGFKDSFRNSIELRIKFREDIRSTETLKTFLTNVLRQEFRVENVRVKTHGKAAERITPARRSVGIEPEIDVTIDFDGDYPSSEGLEKVISYFLTQADVTVTKHPDGGNASRRSGADASLSLPLSESRKVMAEREEKARDQQAWLAAAATNNDNQLSFGNGGISQDIGDLEPVSGFSSSAVAWITVGTTMSFVCCAAMLILCANTGKKKSGNGLGFRGGSGAHHRRHSTGDIELGGMMASSNNRSGSPGSPSKPRKRRYVNQESQPAVVLLDSPSSPARIPASAAASTTKKETSGDVAVGAVGSVFPVTPEGAVEVNLAASSAATEAKKSTGISNKIGSPPEVKKEAEKKKPQARRRAANAPATAKETQQRAARFERLWVSADMAEKRVAVKPKSKLNSFSLCKSLLRAGFVIIASGQVGGLVKVYCMEEKERPASSSCVLHEILGAKDGSLKVLSKSKSADALDVSLSNLRQTILGHVAR
eukprot:CAMPEP_0184484122 /NCGR_PEP_ID=MMETSP0113_2-20130426/5832_1 /TAXON_ID=91329 /ORGANISM="Norrisiella sphaerica, Strain BC52" /LENGTH=1043 /DNA_ID=CAMNT_0026864941 /DNA_START=1 /DNA_END=3132 /DNA_ORIENTATION=+